MKFDKRLLRQIRGVRTYLVVAVGLSVVIGVLIVIQAHYLSSIIHGVFLACQTLDQVKMLLLSLLVVIMVRATLVWGSEVMANRIAGQVKGKSTVAHLLLRFIDPDSGRVCVNGTPLQDVPVQDWRRQVAWVPQHPYLFNATAAENIRFGRPEASLTEVMTAAHQAHAHEFIQALPQGYNTMIGERGTRLSGGQAQRLSLARAFLKNASLLILDEATSQLDPENEALVLQATERLMQGRTVLIIAHRLSTVSNADQIVVLQAGRVVEVGTHASLLQRSGLYKQLAHASEGNI